MGESGLFRGLMGDPGGLVDKAILHEPPLDDENLHFVPWLVLHGDRSVEAPFIQVPLSNHSDEMARRKGSLIGKEFHLNLPEGCLQNGSRPRSFTQSEGQGE